MTPFGRFSRLACPLLAIAAFAANRADAANPEWVGILAEAVQPNMAAELGLSKDQVSKLNSLIEKREADALNIAAALRELPPSERTSKLRDKVRELELEGYRELSIQQRAKLERIRLSKIGLVSLTEAEVSDALGLSQGQIEQIQQILGAKSDLTKERGEEGAKSEIERRLRALLTAGQWATWQAMAGQSAKPVIERSQLAAVSDSGPDASGRPVTAIESQRKEPSPPTPLPEDRERGVNSLNLAGSSNRAEAANPMRVDGEKELSLNFNGMPWEQVLQWISKEAELSLQADSYPLGSFTYRDPYKKYSIGEAIDIMNGVLLNKAYRLVRRQRSLMVLDLGSGESAEVVRGLLRELAELVPPEELDRRGDFELLKCLFVLTRVTPDEAQRQITLLLGPEGSTIPLGSAGQILVTDTAGKLKLIREMLKRVEDPDSSMGSKIMTIPLKHVPAEEVLAVARPLLGLTADTNQSDDIRISTDTFGNTLFATGSPDKLQLLKDAATQVDVKPGDGSSSAVVVESPTLKVHAIQSSDPDTAFNVLQTLLESSLNVRMTLEPKTNSIVASATSADHKLIDDTLRTLAGETSSFTVISLKRIDTQTALTTLEKFFGKPASTSSSAGSSSATTGPIFLGDSIARTIMVKGSPQELSQVRELIDKLEETGPETDLLGGTVRVLPITGKSADRVLDQLQYLWEARQKKNRIQIRVPGEGQPAPLDGKREIKKDSTSRRQQSRLHYVGFPVNSDDQSVDNRRPEQRRPNAVPSNREEASSPADDIIIYRGPTGLIVTCQDPKALEEFEQLFRLVADQMTAGTSEPTVFYLKFVTAKSAEELLRSILAGDSSGGSSSGGGSLIGNMIGEMGGGLVGGLLGLGGSSGGSSTSSVSGGMASGEVTITADPRLNSLLVTANPVDLDLIDQLLQIIDKEDSPLQIQTQGTPHIIPVVYSNAEDMAEVVKQAFAGVMGQSSGGGGGGSQRQQQPSPQEFIEALRGAAGGGGRGGRSGGSSELKPQTMSLAVDKKNNALIVTASQSLADQVRAFVATIDIATEATAERIEVVQLPGVKTELFQSALQSMLGVKAKTNSSSSSPTQTASSNSSSSGSAEEREAAERRAQFMQALQSRFGPGGPGGPTGTPGGGPGGFGGGFRGGFPGGFGGGSRGGAPGGGQPSGDQGRGR
jgi:type II secretory pathway component GspD/PulD (secretin)